MLHLDFHTRDLFYSTVVLNICYGKENFITSFLIPSVVKQKHNSSFLFLKMQHSYRKRIYNTATPSLNDHHTLNFVNRLELIHEYIKT